ncbi:UNVERIFIED_CONTAM: hypothetical protein PYX00_005386 [Menopon gallinae]|uniref:EF-hand domain-containing protein n=1 Tax=Menopon gallinae TaxID=328185 RepID=A0AAW2HRY3_9NEOP
MGNILKALAKRLFEYPIKRKPICFYRQEDFSSTGEPIKAQASEKIQTTEYEELVSSFYENLKAKRKMTKLMQEQNRRLSMKKVLKKYPGWDEMTISNLHNLFLLFDDNKNAMLALDDFCALLESLGDNSPYEVRNAKFEAADIDGDGWITYDEFLPAVYNYNPPEDGNLRGLGKLCFEASENIRFISNLTVGEQLEYGLF